TSCKGHLTENSSAKSHRHRRCNPGLDGRAGPSPRVLQVGVASDRRTQVVSTVGERMAQGHSVDEYLETIYFLAFPIGEYRPQSSGAPTLAARVAEMLGVSRASAGEMLKRLEADGLVERGEHKEAILTPAGRGAAHRPSERRRAHDRGEGCRGAVRQAGVEVAAPAAERSASALSVRSQVKSRSSRPKWPYAAVFA